MKPFTATNSVRHSAAMTIIDLSAGLTVLSELIALEKSSGSFVA
jgi:hypothetical protein